MNHINHTAKWQIFSKWRVGRCWGKYLRTTLNGKIYWIFFVRLFVLLFAVHCIVLFIYSSPFLLSFCLTLSPVKRMKVCSQHGCWLEVMPAASISGPLVFNKSLSVFGANRRSMRMTCFMKKMRYMEKNMRDGHAWSGSEVTAQL